MLQEAYSIELHDANLRLHLAKDPHAERGWVEDSGFVEHIVEIPSALWTVITNRYDREEYQVCARVSKQYQRSGNGIEDGHTIKKLFYQELDNGSLKIVADCFYMDGGAEVPYTLTSIYRGSYTVWPVTEA